MQTPHSGLNPESVFSPPHQYYNETMLNETMVLEECPRVS